MRKTLAAAGVVALITAGSAACGTDNTTPQGKVGNAFQKLGSQKAMAMDFEFGGTADQIYASLKDEDGFTRDDAKLLSSLHLSMGVSSKQDFSLFGDPKAKDDAKDGAASFALSTDESGDKKLAEIRVVDQRLYLRADIKGLEKLDTSKSSASDTAQFNQFLAGADQLPSSLDAVKAGLKGEWISIDPKAFTEFAQSMAKGEGSDSASPVPSVPKLDAKTQAQITAALKKALATNVTYKDLGSHDGADHVQVTAPARQLAKALTDSLGPVLKDVPGYSATSLASSLNGVPDKPLSVDVAIKDGSVSAISFDIVQLDAQAHGKLPLTINLDSSVKPIGAPAGAKVVNPQDIMSLVMSSMGQDTSSGSGTSDS